MTRIALLALVLGASMQVHAACPPGDTNSDDRITVDELVRMVGYALDGCPTPTGDRFIDEGVGTLYDTETGLTWRKFGCDDRWMKYRAAVGYAAQHRSFAGRDDWRLPTTTELLTLAGDGESYAPGFSFIGQGCACSALTCNYGGSPAWSSQEQYVVDFYDTGPLVYHRDENGIGFVRLVAGPTY